MENCLFRFTTSMNALEYIAEMLQTHAKTKEVVQKIDHVLTHISRNEVEEAKVIIQELNELLSSGLSMRMFEISDDFEEPTLLLRGKPGSPSDSLYCIAKGGPEFVIVYDKHACKGLDNALRIVARLVGKNALTKIDLLEKSSGGPYIHFLVPERTTSRKWFDRLIDFQQEILKYSQEKVSS